MSSTTSASAASRPPPSTSWSPPRATDGEQADDARAALALLLRLAEQGCAREAAPPRPCATTAESPTATSSFPTAASSSISGANEIGKSSMIEALDLLLEAKDRSTKKEVKQVKPTHADEGAEVTAEISTGPYRFVYFKRFHKKPETGLTVLAPRREQLTGDEAHERVLAILAETVDTELWQAQRVLQSASTAPVDLSGCDALSRALDVAAGQAVTLSGCRAAADRPDRRRVPAVLHRDGPADGRSGRRRSTDCATPSEQVAQCAGGGRRGRRRGRPARRAHRRAGPCWRSERATAAQAAARPRRSPPTRSSSSTERLDAGASARRGGRDRRARRRSPRSASGAGCVPNSTSGPPPSPNSRRRWRAAADEQVAAREAADAADAAAAEARATSPPRMPGPGRRRACAPSSGSLAATRRRG